MNIAYIHNMEIVLDSRTQKEINSLVSNGHKAYFCGWNKDKDGPIEKCSIELRGKQFDFENICVKVKKRAGIRDNLGNLLKYYRQLDKWLKEHRNDVEAIHACNMDTAYAAMRFAKKYHKKFVYDIYDDYADAHVVGPRLYKIIKKIDAHIINNASEVIICSEKRFEQLASRKNKHIVVIHNTPDIKEVDPNLLRPKQSNRVKLVYVGNLDDTRYIVELVNIVGRIPDIELHIGGGGAVENEVKVAAEKYPNVFYYGRLTYEQTLSLESNCDILPALYVPTLKNHKYAAPNKFYEALYLGKPIIMFKNTGVDDLVEKYNTGVVTQFNDHELESAIVDMVKNISYWQSKSSEIKSIYKRYFSWNIMEERLLDIYA